MEAEPDVPVVQDAREAEEPVLRPVPDAEPEERDALQGQDAQPVAVPDAPVPEGLDEIRAQAAPGAAALDVFRARDAELRAVAKDARRLVAPGVGPPGLAAVAVAQPDAELQGQDVILAAAQAVPQVQGAPEQAVPDGFQASVAAPPPVEVPGVSLEPVAFPEQVVRDDSPA